MTIRPASPDDILRWPDGTWWFRSDHCDHAEPWRGDDFEVLTKEHPEYNLILEEHS